MSTAESGSVKVEHLQPGLHRMRRFERFGAGVAVEKRSTPFSIEEGYKNW